MTILQSLTDEPHIRKIITDQAINRLLDERRLWKQFHPTGFTTKLSKNLDGTLNLFVWDCYIPGEKNTIFEGEVYFMQMIFNNEYPLSPPKCKFNPPLNHPNIFSDGTFCLSLLDSEKWRPSTTVRDILVGIQMLLCEPRTSD